MSLLEALLSAVTLAQVACLKSLHRTKHPKRTSASWLLPNKRLIIITLSQASVISQASAFFRDPFTTRRSS